MRYLLAFIHFCLIVFSYSVYLNQWIPPSVFPYLNYLAIAFPILFLVNIGFIFLWILVRWKYALFFIILSIGLIFPINKTYNILNGERAQKSDFKVMTYNVHQFRSDLKGFESFFKKENPDIYLFQESRIGREDEVMLNQKDFYRATSANASIRSRFPIIKSKKIEGDKNLNAIYADIQMGDDTIRVISVYLSSNTVDKTMMKNTLDSESFPKSTREILSKLKNSSIKHQQQINYIRESITKSPYPVVLGGDFNAVPNSYEYFSLLRGLEDAFVTAGKGLGTTFHEFKFPMRIDYLFSSPEIKATTYEVKRNKLSDHFPVIATFQFINNQSD